MLAEERKRGDVARCRSDLQAILERLPPSRLDVPADYLQQLETSCDA